MTDLITRSMRFKRAENAESRTVDVIASDETIDSYGDIVEQSWNLERYLANPVVLFAHDSDDLPIGTAENVRVEDGALRATLRFVSEKANPLAEQVWRSVQEGTLRAVSVGFYPRDVRFEMRDGKEVCVLANNELLEISVVPVPANPNALAQLRARAAGSHRPEETPMKLPAALLIALSLPETATVEEATAAAERQKRERESLRSALGREGHDEALGALEAYKAAHAAVPVLTAERDALRARVDGFERSALIAEGIRLRKLAVEDADPSTERGAKLAAMPLAGLRTHIELAAPVVPTDPAPTQPKSADAAEALTPDEERLCRQMGHDPAELLASKKAHAAAQRAAGR